MRRSPTVLLASSALLAWTARAQMRPDQPPTLSPPVAPVAAAHGVIGLFERQYRAAGSPRIILFWNTPFNAMTQAPKVDVTVQGAEVTPVETENGETGIASVGVSAHASGYMSSARRGWPPLSAHARAKLVSAFRGELLAAQVRLLGRASTIRFTQAKHDRKGVDPELIEADAVLGKSDILLQVLLVQDGSSPIDTGFKVSALRVKSGTEMLSFYMTALPRLPAAQGHYVATARGFEWEQAPPPVPDAHQIGVYLADQVMERLGSVLAVRGSSRSKGPVR